MSGGSPENLNERALIADIFAPLAAETPGALNLQDDAAFITPPAGKDMVITADAIVAGVHFLETDPADTIAAKALRVNLSDLAAKGAEPLGYTLCLSLTQDTSIEWVQEFARGLQRDQHTYGILLYGGDTVKTPGPLTISITAFGTVKKGCMVKRSGANVGDYLYVTGTIGDGALGLEVALAKKTPALDNLGNAHRTFLLQRYRCPRPRCALAAALVRFATAAMDVSDGLVGDISALAGVSGVSADIVLGNIPLSPAVQALVVVEENLLRQAITGGDDYEIICTVAPDNAKAFETVAKQCDVAVSRIGVMTGKDSAPRFLDGEARQMTFATQRYEH